MTAVVVELVIIGLEALVWLFLLVGVCFDYDWIPFSALADWATMLSLVILAFAYTLGVISNMIFGLMITPFYRRVANSIGGWGPGKKYSYPEIMATLLKRSPDAHKEAQSRLHHDRLLRATLFSIPMICTLSVLYFIGRCGFCWGSTIFALVLGGVLEAMTYIALKLNYECLLRFMKACADQYPDF